jgi:hypothetical protein
VGGRLVKFKRKPRVRLHLVDRPGIDLPRLDGLLVSRRHDEYMLAVPSLVLAAEGNPVTPEGRFVAVPKSGVAFYEIL